MTTRAIWIGTLFAMAAGTSLTLTTEAAAASWAFVGPRYQAMGGAGVAVADDNLATYWNPASLGYARGMGVQLPVGMDASIEGDALAALGGVLDLAQSETVEDALSDIENGITLQPEEAQALLELVGDRFLEVGRPGQSFQASVHLGLLGRYKQIGISGLSLTSANVQPVEDLENLRLGTSPVDTTRLESFLGSGSGGSYGTPTDTSLVALIEATNPIWDDLPSGGGSVTYAEQLVYLAEQAGLDTGDQAVRDLLTTAAEATASGDPSRDISNNATGAIIRGLSTQEVALSLGYALPVPFFKPLDKKIAIGANLKYMYGITYVDSVRYNDDEDVNDILDGLKDPANTKTSHNFGLDLGLAAEPVKWVRLGLVARNVNSPSFDTVGSGSFELEPQVRMGVAVIPLPILTLAADLDLTKNESLEVPGFESRLLSLGGELRLPLLKLFELDLRAGAYTNLVQDMNSDWGLTGGLGLRVWEIAFDVSGGLSPKTEDFPTSSGDKELFTRVNWAASLKWEHRF